MKVKLSVSELQSLFAVMVLAAEAIKQNTIPSREGEDEADLITNLPPKVKEILEKLSESGAKVEVMKVEVSKF